MKSALTLSLMLLFSSVFAQQNADELLKKVIDKTKTYSALKIDFEYRMLNTDAGIDEVKEGVVNVKGDAYKLIMAGQTVISDGKTIWTYLEDSEEVMVSDAAEGEDNITPSRILTSYYEDHKISYVKNRRNEVVGQETVELKPQEGKKFVKIQITIDTDNLQIKSFSIFDNGGNEFVYKLKSMEEMKVIEADFFTFNKADYPDVDVIDMR
ncbi:MAG: outer membrane lipoprotein carrier protein LolA [Bacteroidales bacterium]|nr:outer membrane lipoprotein carrier protein LolA [Bacteroidales bacterium]